MTSLVVERTIDPMATLRFHLPKFARRTPPSGDAGTSAPAESPPTSAGALTTFEGLTINDEDWRYEYPGKPKTTLYTGPIVPGLYRVTVHNGGPLYEIVEGDGPQESGVTPSPSIDTDRLNKLLIVAAATMRESTDRLAAVNAALDQYVAGKVSIWNALELIYRAMGR